MKRLSSGQVLKLHAALSEEFGGASGIRDQSRAPRLCIEYTICCVWREIPVSFFAGKSVIRNFS